MIPKYWLLLHKYIWFSVLGSQFSVSVGLGFGWFPVYHVKCNACPVKFEARKYFIGKEHISLWFPVYVGLGYDSSRFPMNMDFVYLK